MTVRGTVDPAALARSAQRATVSIERLLRTVGPIVDDGSPRERLRWLFDALQSDDVVLEAVRCGEAGTRVEVVYVRSIVDPDRLSSSVLKALEKSDRPDPRTALPHADRQSDGTRIIDRILQGWAAVFKQGSPVAYLTPIPARKGRSVTESTTEPELLAAKDAFVEDLDTNINLIRFRLATPDLTVKLYKMGRISSRRVACLYVRGVCDPALAEHITKRLEQVPQVDYVTSAVDLQQLAFKRSLSPFPQAQQTERPDSVARALAAGRVCLIVDGSPFVMIYPTTLNELDKRSEASFLVPSIAMFIRAVRYLGLLASLTAPAVYVTLMSVSPQLLPPDLLVAVAATREGVPYPVLLETLVMLVTLDVVTEAALHAPAAIGQTLTIVGSLIVGQAAVQAKMASSMMIIVLAVASVGTVLASNLPLSYAFRIVKYPIVVATSVLGLYGLALSFTVLIVHLVSLRSMDVPFMAPLGPMFSRDLLRNGPVVAQAHRRLKRPDAFRPAGELLGKGQLQ